VGFLFSPRSEFLRARAKRLDVAGLGGRSNRLQSRILLTIFLFLLATGPARAQSTRVTVRAGYFPNLTHSQALVGRATADSSMRLDLVRRSNGEFSMLGRP